MMKIGYTLLLGLLMSTMALAQDTIRLSGKVTDEVYGDELIGANIIIRQDGQYITGVSTDYDGNYEVQLAPGIYTVEATYIGYPPHQIVGVVVSEDSTPILNLMLGGDIIIDCYLPMPICGPSVIDLHEPGGDNLNRTIHDEIRNNPSKEISGITLGMSAGVTGGF